MQNMAFLLELISLFLLGCLCVICTQSDLKTGFIYNKVLAAFALAAVVINLVYYGYFAMDILPVFLANIAVVAIVSLYLFYTHSFAGGDCKMTIVGAMLFPARYYWMLGSSNLTLVFAIAFALFSGYCYLLGVSLWAIAKGTVKLSFDSFRQMFRHFLQSYLSATLYLCLLNLLLTALSNLIAINIWVSRGFCMVVAWGVGRFPVLRKGKVLIWLVCLLFVISFITKTIPLSLDIDHYVLTLILVFCQMAIRTTIYESVEVSRLKKGMILTTFSSVLFQQSIT